MRYFYKLLLSILFLLTAALSVVEYSSVAFSLQHSFQREQSNGLIKHQFIKYTIQSAILNLEGKASDSELSQIGKNASAMLNAGEGFTFAAGEDAIYYTSLADLPSFSDIEDKIISYRVVESDNGEIFLQYKSGFSQNGQEMFLVTEQDISKVFSEADALRAQCIRIYFFVLGSGVLVSLGLAYILTRPLTVLRNASRAFSEGEYSTRVKLRGSDEIGELAAAYNSMAETIEEKIQKLEESARRQKRFTANFAHEIKTPMTSIIGYADTIYQKELSPEEITQAAWYIMNEGMRLESLSFKLMDLFSLEQAQLTLEETQIATILEDAVSTVQPVAEKRGILLTCRGESGWVRLEYDLYKTLLLNLIDNALKSGGSKVSLNGRIEGPLYRVSVTDNGRGISAEEVEHITEAFYMVDKSRSRQEHGAGLGLTLCAEIARLHGTKLEYLSSPGQGTVVSFTLKREEYTDEE